MNEGKLSLGTPTTSTRCMSQLAGKPSSIYLFNDFYYYVGFEVLTAVIMRISIFRDITPCSPLRVNRRFGGRLRRHNFRSPHQVELVSFLSQKFWDRHVSKELKFASVGMELLDVIRRDAKIKTGAKTLHILPLIHLTLTTLCWKINRLLLGRPLLIAEYRRIMKSVWPVKRLGPQWEYRLFTQDTLIIR
jgi:hypothetical protein